MIDGWRWLTPGLRIKRYLGYLGLGMFLFGMGAALFLRSIGWLEGGFPGYLPFLLAGLGVVFVLYGVYKTFRSILRLIIPQNRKIVDIIYRKRQLERGANLVGVGGGTGLSSLLAGLKNFTSNLTAIVTVTDDGGSSGRLRRDLHIPPPGDIRNCLIAMADSESLMADLLRYRFPEGSDIAGHSFGNLFLAALTDITGDFELAIKETGNVLAIRGRVIPSSLENVVLGATFADGRTVEGETKITQYPAAIERLFTRPEQVPPTRESLEAVATADLIILGPGSLYTSVLPNLLNRGLLAALQQTKAKVVYVCNVMTQPGETDNYSVSRHLEAIFRHTGDRTLLDYVLVNNATAPLELVERYRAEGAYQVVVDMDKLDRLPVRIIAADLLSRENYLRHDPTKLAHKIMELVEARR